MLVEVVKYDPAWPAQSAAIKRDLECILGTVFYSSIEHVGSTSVPSLAAKPVIDIDIIVDRGHLQDTIDAFSQEGLYLYRGDLGIPERYAFKYKDEHVQPKRHVYVRIEGCQALRNHLAVRDLCRQDAQIRENYGAAKLELSRQEWTSMDEYAAAKSDILNWVLRKAGFDTEELDNIAAMNKKPQQSMV